MKKYLFFLLALLLPVVAWADETPTHTITIESKAPLDLAVRYYDAVHPSYLIKTDIQDDKCIYTIEPLYEGQKYTILCNSSFPETGHVHYSFVGWMRDKAMFSTSPEITIVMGKYDIRLTAVLKHEVEQPYSPGSNHFDAATGVLILDDIRNGDVKTSISVAQEIYNFEKRDVLSCVVIGSIESLFNVYKTFDCFYSLKSLDLSQTSGIETLKSVYGLTLPNLNYIILGASVDSIADAFPRSNINTIDCYATIPPRCHKDAFGGPYLSDSMLVSKDKVLIRVPAESIELYKQADGWKDFPNIQPLQTGNISVKIPTDAPDGYYEDMTVELKNLRSQYAQSLPILNKREFLFTGLVMGNEYQASLKNAYRQLLGQTEPAELGEEELTLTIDKLGQAKEVSVKVTLPDGTDITDKVSILWTDEADKTIGYVPRLRGVADGTKLSCTVKLRDELARQYVAPDAMQLTVNVESSNLLTLQLQPVQQMTLHGLVKDKETGEPVADATVSLTQQLGDGYTEAVTAKTDENGHYELQGTNEHGELSASAPAYLLPKKIQMGVPAADGALPDIEMEMFHGITVTPWFTYTKTVAEGEEAQTIDGYDAFDDAAYQVYNKTKNSTITNFISKERKLYFLSGVRTGDELIVTVSSQSNSFSPVSDTCEIPNNGLGYVTLPIVQKGALTAQATYFENASVMGVLYDSDGFFVRSNTYKSHNLDFANLAPGDYTLITMTTNTLLRHVLLLSTLNDMKLIEGTDYAKTAVHIEDGRILSVDVGSVPALDMEKLRFTKNKYTYIGVDKNILNVGQTNTVYSYISFADQYAGRISNVELLVDLPQEIDLVENSVFLGSRTDNYRIENGQYIFPNIEDNALSFCLKPLQVGEFRVSGSVRFKLDGVETIQPIGTVWVIVNGFNLKSTMFFSPSDLLITGTGETGYRGNKIDIYDYDQLVATTSVEPTGEWSVLVKYPSTVINQTHAIKARMTVPDAGVIESDVKYVTFSPNNVFAKRVVMLDQRKNPITFDLYDPSAKQQSYIYKLEKFWSGSPYTTEFTFLAYFDDMDMSNVEKVHINVLASDGTIRTLDAEYDDVQQCWYAISNYPNTNKIPISAYAYTEGPIPPMSDEEKAARAQSEKEHIEKIMQAARKAAEKGETELLPCDDETLNFQVSVSDKDPFVFSIKEMDYDEAAAYALENEPFVLKGDEGNIVYTMVNGVDEMEIIHIDVDEHIALRTVISHAEIGPLSPMAQRKIPGNYKILFGKSSNMASEFLDAFDYTDFIVAPANMNHMELGIEHITKVTQIKKKLIKALLNKKCHEGDVGKPWFTDQQQLTYRKFMFGLEDRSKALIEEMKQYQKSYTDNLYKKGGIELGTFVATGGIGKGIKALVKLSPKVFKVYSKANRLMETENGTMISGQVGYWTNATDITPPDVIKDLLELDFDFGPIYQQYEKVENKAQGILNSFDELYDNAYNNRADCKKDCEESNDEDCDEDCEGEDCQKKCKGEDCCEDGDCNPECEGEDCDPGPGPGPGGPFPKPAKPCIDPSGYIYEAVPSNRVEGATATIYSKDFMLGNSGNSTGEQDVLWDAENYGQINPQITGTDGMYQWDVPQGLWQVRVQKEGYQNNTTDWLPVPPPQLDINIPIVRLRLPKVQKAHAYEDAVAVKFDSYMIPAFLTTDQITVTENGNTVEGTIELTDEEAAADGVTYASQLRFVPSKLFTANEVTLRISGKVQNYSGIAMDEPFEATLPIEKEVKKLVADEKIKVRHGGTEVVHVKGEPAVAAAGKTVTVKCMSGIIASAAETQVVLNKDGEADVFIHGDLPGKDFVIFTLDDPELTATSTVRVSSKSATGVEAPEASVPSETEVQKGTQITLSCTTENAIIYYTLDGTNPGTSDTRVQYNAPIVINEETTIKAVAVLEGKGESEVVTYHYTVASEQAITEVNSHDRKIIPVRVHDVFEVSGMDGNFSVSVYSMSGALQMRQEMVKSGQKVNAATLPTGIYLVVVNGKADFTQRIIKD